MATAIHQGESKAWVERVQRALERYIREKGLKSTRQRDSVVEALIQAREHVTAEQLLAQARRLDPRISPATVYRTMRLLVESGLATAHHFGGQTLYEVRAEREHHDHLICTRCRAIIEFENDKIEHLQDLVARRHGFLVTDHKLELYGLCRDCRAEEKR